MPVAGEAMVTAQAATLLAWDAGCLLFSAAVAASTAPYVPRSRQPVTGVPVRTRRSIRNLSFVSRV